MNTPWGFLDSYRDRITGSWPSLPVMFGITRDRFPENDCFIVFDPEPLRLSYAEAHEKSIAAASNLVADGAKPGDRIGVTGKNSPEWAIAYLAVLFTSGTGTLKGVMLSHGNLVSDCYLAQSQLEVLPTDVFYALLPLHHSYTMQAVFIESMGAGSARKGRSPTV